MVVRIAPASFDAFVRDYDHFIEVSIHRISRGCVREDDLPDLKQAVYTRVWETRYLDRYRPERGSFSNYLYILIRSVLVNQFDKNTRNPLNHAIGVVERSGSREEAGRLVFETRHEVPQLVLETYKDLQDADWERRQEAADLMAKLAAYTRVTREGAELAEVLRLLYEGYTVLEVAARMDRAPAEVRSYCQRLRDALVLADARQFEAAK